MRLQPWKTLSSKHIYKHVGSTNANWRMGKSLKVLCSIMSVTLGHGSGPHTDKQVVMEKQYRHGIQKPSWKFQAA